MVQPRYSIVFVLGLAILDVFLFFKLNEEYQENRKLTSLREDMEQEWSLCSFAADNRKSEFQRREKEFLDRIKDLEKQLAENGIKITTAERTSPKSDAFDYFDAKIRKQQFPSDCKDPNLKFIRCDMSMAHTTGFGCQMHHFAMCLVTGWVSNRTVVFDFNDHWSYAAHESCDPEHYWECFFQPISACTLRDISDLSSSSWAVNADPNIRVHHLTFRQSMPTYTEYLPEDMGIFLKFHKRPQLWFVGNLVKFLLRMNDDLRSKYEETKNRLFPNGFPRPFLTIHARGDDSGTERDMLMLDTYISEIPERFRGTEVYLATDDARNIRIAEQTKNFTWIRNIEGEKVISLNERHKAGALEKLVIDIHLLSEGDLFIGSDGSQISRAVYELMQTKSTEDNSDRGWSINTIKKDKKYFFWWFFI
eukprot:TRINITY_DN730_c0_g1_i1.p1 TRINITY_DN730_c0_g1~~TRINITY_DN730_c0_g1_i1.p1  ORF type:complete len:420 (-),score=90.20 TRINITY_DN730_c0_g1_i1:5-1264(-)